ncbi:MAG TPA: amino acid adenylation domain-containing protein [bacterium]|nr:amino acid adenylation domain-containing protein [bacterium]
MRPYLLSHLVPEAACRRPDHTAVRDANGSISYGELDRRTNRLARVLRDAGVRPGARVGLFLSKSVDAITGVYGILKAGAAYVPLDPLAPAARLAYIARNCDIHCLVTGREKSDAWDELRRAGAPVDRFVVLDGRERDLPPPPAGTAHLAREALEASPDQAFPLPGISRDLAYILYTSGSTGQPKGVMLSHQNALAFVEWCRDYFRPRPTDVLSNHAPLHFDLTILDIYLAAMASSTLVVVAPETSVFPAQLAELIERERITIWYSVPSILTLLLLHGRLRAGRLPSLRHVIFAGEVFPTKHLRRLMALLPHAEFTNLYGPTETNVCTYYRVPPLPEDQTAPIPIGRAIANVEVFAVNDDGRRAARGEVGELHVRGDTVAYGYWGNAEGTARAFIEHPFGATAERVYRTGDLVQETPDGDFLFLGRRDHQIKSRGYRIEIGDIEAALHSHPQVAACAVIAVPDDVVGSRLKAFVVPQQGPLTDGELARFSATLLPKYMVPESFTFLETLPQTSTGKVDRGALAAALKATEATRPAAPATPA